MKKTALLLLVFVTVISLFSACAGGTEAVTDGNNTVTTSTETGYHIHFFRNGQQVASLGLDELHSLPEVKLVIAGKDSDETGPTLSSVLALAGIKDYSKIKVDGMLKGRIATGELTLNKSEITDEVMFDFNNQGKTKLCGSKIHEANWIIDVTEIYTE
jgi:hypothetical protein